MANDPKTSKATARASSVGPHMDSSGLAGSHCNLVDIVFRPKDVILNFGSDDRPGSGGNGSRKVRATHKVILNIATARRVKDGLITGFKKRDSAEVHVKVQQTTKGKLN